MPLPWLAHGRNSILKCNDIQSMIPKDQKNKLHNNASQKKYYVFRYKQVYFVYALAPVREVAKYRRCGKSGRKAGVLSPTPSCCSGLQMIWVGTPDCKQWWNPSQTSVPGKCLSVLILTSLSIASLFFIGRIWVHTPMKIYA